MMTLISLVTVFCLLTDLPVAPPDTSVLQGRWEGVLTQQEGGVLPEYRMVLMLRQQGDKVDGYAEVWFGEEIYVKHLVSGTLTRGFFLELEDGDIIQSKALKDKAYCRKTYQLALSRSKGRVLLKGRWQGKTEFGPCVPGKIQLERKGDRA